MDVTKGQIVSVTRKNAVGSSLIADAAISDTVLYLEDVAYFSELGGDVEIDGTVLAYDTVDAELNTLTLSAPLAGALTAYDTFVAVSPQSPEFFAEVLLADDSGVTVPAVIPHTAHDLLEEGPRDPDQRESASLMFDGEDWVVTDVRFRPGVRDAATVPIVVRSPNGELARLDGDGLKVFTNDEAIVWSQRILDDYGLVVVSHSSATGDDEDVYVHEASTRLYKRTADGGTFYTSNWAGYQTVPSGATLGLAVIEATGSNFGDVLIVCAADNDIRRWDVDGGEQIGSGFPIVGTFGALATDGTHLWTVDSANDIRKFAISNGVEVVTGGWPIAGTFVKDGHKLVVDSTHVYAIDSGTSDVRKFAKGNGVEVVTGGFPIVGTFAALALRQDGTSLWIGNDQYSKTDGTLIGSYTGGADLQAVTEDAFYVSELLSSSNGDPANQVILRRLNREENFQSARIDSSDGEVYNAIQTVVEQTVVGRLNVTGWSTLSHETFIDQWMVGGEWETYTTTWAGATTNPAIGNGTLTAKYKRIGQAVKFKVEILMGSTTTYGTGQWSITLPFTPANTVRRYLREAGIYDTSAALSYPFVGVFTAGSTTVSLFREPTTAGSSLSTAINNTSPIPWATGDTLSIFGEYEAA